MNDRIYCWTYASRSTIVPHEHEEALGEIVAVARSRNLELDVTGALIFTGERFAQHIEGPEEGIRELMASIKRDRRHEQVVTLQERSPPSRRFSGWSLAYAGPSRFVSRTVELPLQHAASGSDAGLERLLVMLEEFAADLELG